jgi:hypothetical protein
MNSTCARILFQKGRSAGAVKDSQITRNEIQIFSERNPSRTEGKPNQILGVPSLKRAFSITYADPQGIFLFHAASGL